MTKDDIEKAIEVLLKNRPTTDTRECGEELCKAVDVAVEALKQLSNIKEIINSSLYIEEDVIRYKMICLMLEDTK